MPYAVRKNNFHVSAGIKPNVGVQQFETSDRLLASFLCCRNFDLIRFRRSEEGETFFVFHDSPELRWGITDFVNDGVVPVKSFCSMLRHLESIGRKPEEF